MTIAAVNIGDILTAAKINEIITTVNSPAGSSFSSTNDTTSNATYYPLSATAAGGSSAVTSSTKLTFNPSTGTLGATVVQSLSDKNSKTNIVPVTGAAEVISQLSGVSFDWKDGSGSSYGFISQDVQRVLPHAVSESEGKLMLNYSAIIPFLVETVKQQQTKIAALELAINSLTKE